MFTIINEYQALLRKAGLKDSPKQDVYLPKESKVLWTRYLSRGDSTKSKACGRLEESQVTTE